MADCHTIHGRIEVGWAWLGLAVSVPDNETVKNSGLARLGSDRVGLAKERVGNSGDSAGGPWEINRAAFKLAWLGFNGGGGLGPSTHLIQ